MSDDAERPKVKVKRASSGLGLFAAEFILKDHVVIEYTGERITEEEANRRGGRYLFQVTDTLVIDGKGRENLGRYINHACKPNCEAEHDEEEDRIFIRACTNIAAGDEITYHYGKEYVREIIKKEGCQCASCMKKK
jgi:SET domain-containing protein